MLDTTVFVWENCREDEAVAKLLHELQKGAESIRSEGGLSLEEAFADLDN